MQPFPLHLNTPSNTQVQHYLPVWQLYCDFGGFSNGLCHVMKIYMAERDPDMQILAQQISALAPTFWLHIIEGIRRTNRGREGGDE